MESPLRSSCRENRERETEGLSGAGREHRPSGVSLQRCQPVHTSLSLGLLASKTHAHPTVSSGSTGTTSRRTPSCQTQALGEWCPVAARERRWLGSRLGGDWWGTGGMRLPQSSQVRLRGRLREALRANSKTSHGKMRYFQEKLQNKSSHDPHNEPLKGKNTKKGNMNGVIREAP